MISEEPNYDPIITEQSKKTKRRKLTLSKERVTDEAFSIETFEKANCTYGLFGNEPLEQPVYHCVTCDPNRNDRICMDCFEICHKDCKREVKYVNAQEIEKYICDCGKHDKHKIMATKKSDNKPECKFDEVDRKIKNSCSYFCSEHNHKLCSICYHECHSDCNESAKKKVHLEKADEKFECECQHDNHLAMNEFTFNINPTEYQNECNLPFIWPVQMLNVLFASETSFVNLTKYIHKNLKELKKEVQFSNIISMLSGVFTKDFNTYYYHPNISNLFPYEKFIVFFYKFRTSSIDDLVLKMRMVNILLFMHLKKDFTDVKEFTISDFMTSTILDRLLYKKFLVNPNVYTKTLHQKYHINVKDQPIPEDKITASDISLSRITLKICALLVKATKKLSFSNNQKEYNIILEYFNFILINPVLRTNELHKIISALSNFNDLFIAYVMEDSEKTESEDTKGGKARTVDYHHTFTLLAKIFFLIGVTLNDIIFKNSLRDPKSHRDGLNFIHTFKEENQDLFRMIVKNCCIISDYYSKIPNNSNVHVKSLNSQTVKVFTEALKLFSLADNIYYYQITDITSIDLVAFELRYKKLSSREEKFINKNGKEKLIGAEFDPQLIPDFKKKVENALGDFFTFKNTKDTKSRVFGSITEYSRLFHKKLKETKSFNPNKSLNIEKSVEMSNMKKYRLSELESYIEKLKRSIMRHFEFVNVNSFNDYTEEIVEDLIFNSVDETITKFFYFFNSNASGESHLLTEEENDILLSFLSLFCLNKSGITFFCFGKNLDRIAKIFKERKISRILHFLFYVFKGMSLFEVKIKNHAILQIREKLLDYLNSYEINSSNLNDFLNNLILIIKVFLMTSDYYENEEYEEIKKSIINVMLKNRLLDRNKFRKIFDEKMFTKKPTLKRGYTKAKVRIGQVNANEETSREDEKGLLIMRENSKNKSPLGELINGEQVNLLSDEAKPMKNLKLEDKKILNPFNSDKETTHSIRPTSDSSLNDETKIYNRLFFNFFELISKNTYYVKKDPKQLQILDQIYSFCDLPFFNRILKENSFLSVKKRQILLNFLRTYYFIDILDFKDYDNRFKHLTTSEYKTYFINTLQHNQKVKIDNLEVNKYPIEETYKKPNALNEYKESKEAELKKKFEFINEFIKIIELYINELGQYLHYCEEEPESAKEYLRNLIYSVKFIADFMYQEKDIWSKVTITYYKLVKVFIQESKTIKGILAYLEKGENIVGMTKEELIKLTENSDAQVNFNIFLDKSYVAGESPEKKVEASSIVTMMERHEFDIFNKKNLYDLVMQSFTELFCKETGLDNDGYKLKTYLTTYDNTVELNFTPSSLLDVKDYEYFYEKLEEEDNSGINNEHGEKLSIIKGNFEKQFIDVENSTFLRTIKSISGEAELTDYRKNIVEYFINYINCDISYHNNNFTYTLLCMITKLLYYDTVETQTKLYFLTEPSYDNFFIQFNLKLQYEFVVQFSSLKNIFVPQRFLKISMISKLIIQFLQLLSEGFRQDFYSRIFPTILDQSQQVQDDENNGNTNSNEVNMDQANADPPENSDQFYFFRNISKNLVYCTSLMNVSGLTGEHYSDKLIVLYTNIIDFIIEYAQQKFEYYDDYKDRTSKEIQNLFKCGISKTLFIRLDKGIPSTCRKNILNHLKLKLISLISAYLCIHDEKKCIKVILKDFNPVLLFEEILFNLDDLLNEMIRKEKVSKNIKTSKNFVNDVIDLYIYEEDFQESLQLRLCFEIYKLIKIYTLYSVTSLKNHFEDFEENEEETTGTDEIKKEDLNINSQFALKVYNLMEHLVVNVVACDYTSFFVRPALTFHLTEQSIGSFFDNVNRESATSKLTSLVNECDYFICEMVYNSHFRKGDFLNRIFKNLKFVYVEIVNYFLIIIHQILLIYRFYKRPGIEDETYFIVDPAEKTRVNYDNFILSLIQIAFLAVILLLWAFYKLPLYFQHNVMNKLERKFIFEDENAEVSSNKRVQKYFNEKNFFPINIIREINSDLGFFSKLKISFIDSIIFNNEINTLFFSFVLNILYLFIGSPIILVVPCLLIANLSPILNDIFLAMKMRWKALLIVLIFTYLLIYLFMWITLLWVSDIFYFDSAKNPQGVSEDLNFKKIFFKI
jgi:hypothetical protein